MRAKKKSLSRLVSARLRRLASRPAHAPAAYLFGTHSDTRQRRRPLSLCDSPRTAASIAAASSPAACAAGASPTALLCCLPLLPPHSLLSPYTVCSGAPRAPIQCPHQPARPHQHRPHQPHGPLLRVSSPATSGPSHQHRAPLTSIGPLSSQMRCGEASPIMMLVESIRHTHARWLRQPVHRG